MFAESDVTAKKIKKIGCMCRENETTRHENSTFGSSCKRRNGLKEIITSGGVGGVRSG